MRDGSEEIEPPPGNLRRAAMNVVVVEDNLRIVELYVEFLAELGHAAQVFRDGGSFLDALPGLSPDLLILDRNMPGLDGLEVARRVRTLRPGLPILMISGSASMPARAAGTAEVDRFLAKPCTISQFTGAVRELLGAVHGETTRR
jgi:DNA-binding response OmpR family regulator